MSQLCCDLSGPRKLSLAAFGRICAFIVILTSASVCLAQDPVQLWFPLNDGDVRNYQFAAQTLQEQVAYDGAAGTRRIFRITEAATVARLSTGDGVLRLESLTDSGFLIEFRPGLQILTAATALRGGSLASSAPLILNGSLISGGVVSLTSTISLIGPVTVAAGNYLDCRELKWNLRVSIPGRSAGLISQAFVLAPQVGPIREAAIDDNQNFLGWWDLASGTVGGFDVQTIANRIAPSFTEQPTNQTALVGLPLTLSATATGNPSPSYQWQRKPAGLLVWSNLVDSGTFVGTVSAELLLQNTTTNLSGDQFRCVVTNALGTITSRVASVTILVLPSLVQQPTNLIVNLGKTATFSVAAAGTAPLSYQWLKGGIRITGATAQTFSIAAVKATDGADYSVTVTNMAGMVDSASATLTVIFPPTLTQAPTNVTVVVGESAMFSVTATANAPLTYQWRKGTANILGATGMVYTIPVTKTTDAGSYTVVVSDRAGSVTSAAAVLTVKPAVLPVIALQPTNQTVPLGQRATFVVGANSRPSPTYQWSKNKVALPGATNASLVLHGVSASDAGSYTVLVKNTAGGVTSVAAELVVGPPMALDFLSSGSLLPDGSFQIRWIGGQGMITVEASDDLTNWQSVAQEEAASEFRTYTDAGAGTASQRFYRVRSER